MKTLTEYVRHFNELKDLEVINYTENKDTAYVDMVINDHAVWDELSDRQFRVLTDTIQNKAFNTYRMEFYVTVDQDPVGITLTLVYNKNNEPKGVDEVLNTTVKDIQNFLEDLTTSK